LKEETFIKMRNRLQTILLTTGILLSAATQLAAQATRTWVSGVGDDANPCSRTAPCKTFAGAISKTAVNGEINVLDPGGFGALTITKSIRIDGGGFVAGVLVSGTNGIVVAAGPNDTVVLRGLDIDGLGVIGDFRGVQFISGKQLIIDKCNIYGFGKRNISIQSSTNGAQVLISNTLVHDSVTNGIIVAPPGVTNNVVLDNVVVANNAFFGIGVTAGGSAQIRNSTIGNSLISGAGGGLLADNSTVDVQSTLISGNLTGIQAQNSATIRISNATIVENTVGLAISSGAIINSFGNNQIAGNGSGNSGVSSIPRQ
jgi:hypothetical protein